MAELMAGHPGKEPGLRKLVASAEGLPGWAIIPYNPLKRPFLGLMGMVRPNSPDPGTLAT